MYIREIYIKTFRNLRDVRLGPFAAPAPKSELIVLAGSNGGGKSSILELIGFALSSSFSLSWQLRRSFPEHSFEVAIGVTGEELRLLDEFVRDNPRGNHQQALEHLSASKQYSRQFSAKGDLDASKRVVYDQCHQLVRAALRNHYRRSLGFFLKPDRFYPPEGFRWQDALFQHEQMRQLEHIWNMAYTSSDAQYRDIYDFLVQQRYHYLNRLGAYHKRRKQGDRLADGETEPEDPLVPYEKLLQEVFPEYAFADKEEPHPSNLFVRLPDGVVIPFTDLSSGEKEVFFLLSFFIRHGVRNAVMAVDEPELHLHPELARRLVRSMLEVQPGNQVWLATHNAEIIDEAGRDRAVYISRRRSGPTEVVLGSNEPAAALKLRDLFGVSGYIGVAKSMVFLEGQHSSADRKTFGWLFKERAGSVKLIPAGGVDNLARINAAVLSILDAALGVCQFYLIRDRDYLTAEQADAYGGHASGRLYVLGRNQIENYLLDGELVSRVLAEFFDVVKSAAQVDADLRDLARRASGEVLREMVAYRLGLALRPQDFGLGRALDGQPVLDEAGEWLAEPVAGFGRQLAGAVGKAEAALRAACSEEAVAALLGRCQAEVKAALSGDGWRAAFPGKRLLEELAKRYGLKNVVAFQNSLIKGLAADRELIPLELSRVMDVITAGGRFASAAA